MTLVFEKIRALVIVEKGATVVADWPAHSGQAEVTRFASSSACSLTVVLGLLHYVGIDGIAAASDVAPIVCTLSHIHASCFVHCDHTLESDSASSHLERRPKPL